MKILLINKFWYPQGGADVYAINLRQTLLDQGHEVVCFGMEHKDNIDTGYNDFFTPFFDVQDEKISFSQARKFINNKEAEEKLDVLIEKTKPDMAHLHNIYHQLSTSILVSLKKHNIPSVMTLHDYKVICPNYRLFTQDNPCERCQYHKFYNATLHKCHKNRFLGSVLLSREAYYNWRKGRYKMIDQFIAPSHFIKNKFKDWRIEQGITHISNYIDMPLQKHEKKPYHVFAGRLSEEKGLAILPEVIKKTNLKWKIAGTGPLEKELKEKCPREKTEFLGFRKGKELIDLIGEAQSMIHPSISYDNNPLIVHEAHSQGTYVIASDIGGLPELIQKGKTGDLAIPRDADDFANKLNKQPPVVEPFYHITRQEHFNKLEKVYAGLIQ